jgi:hypothetical protein
MIASEIAKLVARMEAACEAFISQPANVALRQDLHAALSPALAEGFQPDLGIDRSGDGKVLYGLMRQAAAYARILRTRIDSAASGRFSEPFASEHLVVAARELQSNLFQLRRFLDLGA